MYKRSEQCLVSTTFFAPPPPECCAAESQPVSNIRDEERFSGSRGGGLVWVWQKSQRRKSDTWTTSCPHMIYIFSFKMLH